jgi:hypothetical protein
MAAVDHLRDVAQDMFVEEDATDAAAGGGGGERVEFQVSHVTTLHLYRIFVVVKYILHCPTYRYIAARYIQSAVPVPVNRSQP